MANLHPLEYEHNDRVSVSAAVGSYKSHQALAAGVYSRPDRKSLISISGSMGNGENMLGVGFSKKLGQMSEIDVMTEDQLRDKVSSLTEENTSIKKQLADLTAKVDSLVKQLHS